MGPPGDNPGVNHWQASYIEREGLEDRGNIFFAAVEMTRMPVLVTTGYMDELPGRGPSGSLDVLSKPYQHQDLLDRVAAALKRAA